MKKLSLKDKIITGIAAFSSVMTLVYSIYILADVNEDKWLYMITPFFIISVISLAYLYFKTWRR